MPNYVEPFCLHYSFHCVIFWLIKFFHNLKNFLEILTSMPYLGKIISNYDFEIRQIIYQKYFIFYIIQNDEIYILRILHNKTNIENEFYNSLIS